MGGQRYGGKLSARGLAFGRRGVGASERARAQNILVVDVYARARAVGVWARVAARNAAWSGWLGSGGRFHAVAPCIRAIRPVRQAGAAGWAGAESGCAILTLGRTFLVGVCLWRSVALERRRLARFRLAGRARPHLSRVSLGLSLPP